TVNLDPAIVQSWIDDPNANQGILLVNETAGAVVRVDASENASATLRPKLSISYTVSSAASQVGDYNQNGVVDAADYTRWRDTLGQTGIAPSSGADGDGDGAIDSDDYNVWKNHFGNGQAAAAASAAKQAVPIAAVSAAPVANDVTANGFTDITGSSGVGAIV